MISKEYIAGLFDGEGTVYIWLNKPNKKSRTHGITAQIVNTDRNVLDLLSKQYHSIVYKHPKYEGYKICYQWRIYADDLPIFLEDILPFIIIKKKRVEVAIEFIKIKGGYTKITPDVFEKRDKYRILMKELNKRGD